MNVNFHLRDLTEKTEQKIWAIFFHESKRVKIDTGLSIKPLNWSKDKQKALTNFQDFNSFNGLLREINDFILSYVGKLSFSKKRLYKDELQQDFNIHFKIGNIKPKEEGEITDFITYIDYHINNKGERAIATTKSLKVCRKNIILAFNLVPEKNIKAYNKLNRKGKKESELINPMKPLEFDKIDFRFMNHFKQYLLRSTFTVMKNKKELIKYYSKNYIAKEIKTIKQFINAAYMDGYVKDLTYRNIKSEWEESDTIHTDWNEIELLKKAKLESGSILDKVRDLYVFNCYCGLRFSDLAAIQPHDFLKVGGELFLKIRQLKTDEQIKFPILPSAKSILEKYNYNMPKISAGKFNLHIKDVCYLAGITSIQTKREGRGGKKTILTLPKYRMVSSHTGRRSFATNFYEKDVPLKEIMAVTGHSSETTLNIYIKEKGEKKFTGFKNIGANL